MRNHLSMRNLSLRQKLFYWLTLTTIIPLLIFLPPLTLYQSYAIQKSIDRMCLEQSNQTSVQLDRIFNQINSISNLYFLDPGHAPKRHYL